MEMPIEFIDDPIPLPTEDENTPRGSTTCRHIVLMGPDELDGSAYDLCRCGRELEHDPEAMQGLDHWCCKLCCGVSKRHTRECDATHRQNLRNQHCRTARRRARRVSGLFGEPAQFAEEAAVALVPYLRPDLFQDAEQPLGEAGPGTAQAAPRVPAPSKAKAPGSAKAAAIAVPSQAPRESARRGDQRAC